MLVPERDTETIFFISFIERAIKGEEAYIKIVKPIILDAVACATKKIRLWDLDRVGLEQKLTLQKFDHIKEITEDNLMLPEMLEFFNKSLYNDEA